MWGQVGQEELRRIQSKENKLIDKQDSLEGERLKLEFPWVHQKGEKPPKVASEESN